MWSKHDIDTKSSGSPTRCATCLVMMLLALTQPLLQGCAPVVVAGVAVGASVVHERRDAGTVFDDQQIEAQAMAALHNDPELKAKSRIAITSYNRVALLTGQTETQKLSDRFAEMVSRLPKVKRVVNEVAVAPLASFARESEDALITSRVKFELTRVDLPGFDPTRVKVVTEAGIVYLMGLVSPEEADATAEKARYVPGVEKVVKIFEYVDLSAPAA